jgi:hypothetical protein
MVLGLCARRLMLVASICGLTGSGACDSELDLQYHGRRLVADGNYRVVAMYGDGRDEFVLANDRARDDEMALLPFDGKPCRIGEVARYFAVRSSDGLRIGLYDSNETPRGLRFIDAHCKPSLPEIADVVDTKLIDGGFLVTIDGGRLLLVDPWKGSSARRRTCRPRAAFRRRPRSGCSKTTSSCCATTTVTRCDRTSVAA